ncbi:hypothetical protein EHQ47_16650 [Leptospira bourretii]|uniref:hypothetical protein n=1 Tax=Leptospira bourretii TaxID=2484962 RepID=UPI001090E917|nr:hypothetical protein [Leptospira bourretii]TGL19726.1 hypothetical protein EHQ47_16650 [Leptospira bourretii]
MLSKAIKFLRKNSQSQYVFIKFIINPILGIILTLLILILFSPLVYKKNILNFTKYKTYTPKLNIENKCERNFPNSDSKRIQSFLNYFQCEDLYDFRSQTTQFYYCKKNILENINLTVTNFNNHTNLEFPTEFEKSLKMEYSIVDFFNNKQEYLTLKLSLLNELESSKNYHITGYDQIYFIEELQNKHKIGSFFYDFGSSYYINYHKKFNNKNEAQEFVQIIENYCIQ